MLRDAQDANHWERAGLIWLAAGCIALGLFPGNFIELLNHTTRLLLGIALDLDSRWLMLAPIKIERASYSPILFFTVITITIGATWLLVRHFYHGRVRRGPAWDCGYARQTPRMQDSAEGFGQPVRHLFAPFFGITGEAPTPSERAPRYKELLSDRMWQWIYPPIANWTQRAAAAVAQLQQGRISVYLIYSFLDRKSTRLNSSHT